MLMRPAKGYFEEIKSVSPAVASLRETEVLPITGERRIVARIATATSVVIELNLKMQQALADIIHKLRSEHTMH